MRATDVRGLTSWRWLLADEAGILDGLARLQNG
jgi:hypothetical protein